MTTPLLTQRDVCALLRISAKTLQRFRRECRIKFLKFGPTLDPVSPGGRGGVYPPAGKARGVNVGSLFAGIGGFDEGLRQAGNALSLAGGKGAVLPKSSKDAIPERAAGRRYSYLPWVDLICAGVPCQDWSVAGQRKGLRGQRSSLVYQFARILHELRPTWFLFENVPGLLSSNDGRDFAEVLRLFMVKCGYGIQWRVLDSQFFGVAQRRRRLFVVGRFGKPCPAEILFERESCCGNFAPGEETRPDVAVPLTSGVGITGNAPGRRREDDFNLAFGLRESDGHHGRSSPRGDGCDNLIPAFKRRGGFGWSERNDGLSPTLESQGGSHQGGSEDTPLVLGRYPADGHSRLLHAGEGSDDARETAFCLRVDPGGIGQGHNTTYCIQDVRGGTRDKTDSGQGIGIREAGPMYTISKTEQHAIAMHMPNGVRLPESGNGTGDGERIVSGSQPVSEIGRGMPDPSRCTALRHLGSGGADDNDAQGGFLHVSAPSDSHGMRDFAGLPKGLDSARYRALGNAVTVPVIRWIGERIVRYGGG